MKTIKTLIAAAALATVSTATFAADDSPAAQRVQQSISQDVVGTAQSAATQQASFAETGMSVAAGRIQQSISADRIHGQSHTVATASQAFDNDAGKSVAATRVQHALNDSNV